MPLTRRKRTAIVTATMNIRDKSYNHHQSDGPEYPHIDRELENIGASIKTMHTEFPKGTKFGYTAAIITAGGYWKRVTSYESAWTFTKPTKPETKKQSIKTSATELTKSHKEAAW